VGRRTLRLRDAFCTIERLHIEPFARSSVSTTVAGMHIEVAAGMHIEVAAGMHIEVAAGMHIEVAAGRHSDDSSRRESDTISGKATNVFPILSGARSLRAAGAASRPSRAPRQGL
jgi:hypothetical protein